MNQVKEKITPELIAEKIYNSVEPYETIEFVTDVFGIIKYKVKNIIEDKKERIKSIENEIIHLEENL